MKVRDSIAVLVVLAAIPAGVEGGPIQFWQLKEAAAAPLLVVGRVLSVQKGEPVPEGSMPWTAETLAMTAEIQVLRSYPDAMEPAVPERLRVRFFAYGPSVTQFVNGYPPPLPSLEPGRVLILPLQENKHPSLEPWQLIADSGVSLTIPARAEMQESEHPPASARVFLLREVANALDSGTPAEVSAVAGYLDKQEEDLTGELMALIGPAIGDDRDRWAEVATNLLAAEGIPRPSVADLLSGKAELKKWPGRQNVSLAQAALEKLKASRDTDTLLIKTWIAEAPLHAWGSANSLLEYSDNAVTNETLRRALRDDVAGTSYIAWTLARNGDHDILADALARALKVVDRPDAEFSDLQGAAALLEEFGNNEQLTQLANVVRKYQTQDEKFYSLLWQDATGNDNPRSARVLAVVLRDRRIVFGEFRYCDLAVGALERAIGQKFGAGADTQQERDAAVSGALAWLASQGIS